MNNIKLSFKAFVDFLFADHAGQRDALAPFRFPDEESKAKRTYYHQAIAAIRHRHRGVYSRHAFLAQAARMRADAASAVGPRRTKCLHNARVIEQYDALVGDAPAPAQAIPRGWLLNRGDVFVGVNPDLHLLVRKKSMIVKLWTSTEAPTPMEVKALTQIMHAAALAAGVKLPSSAFVLIDVARGALHRGAKVGSRMQREIEAGLANVAALWPTLTPRIRRARRRA